MIITNKFARKPFYVDAVRVDDRNIEEVAVWCGGDVRTEADEDGLSRRYVKVRVHRPIGDRQTQAFVGDWVLYAGTGFKVYTHKAFLGSFEETGEPETFVYPKRTEEKFEAAPANISSDPQAPPSPEDLARHDGCDATETEDHNPNGNPDCVFRPETVNEENVIDPGETLLKEIFEEPKVVPGPVETQVEGEIILSEDKVAASGDVPTQRTGD